MRPALWAMLGLVGLACGPRTYAVRLQRGERLGDRILRELDEAQRAQEALELDRAARALADARADLDDPDAALAPEAAQLSARYQELAQALPGARGERDRKALEKRLDALRDKVVPATQALQEGLARLKLDAPTDRQLEAVEGPAREVLRRLEDSGALFAEAPDFDTWARAQRGKAEKALAQAATARARRAFLQGPARDLEEAETLMRGARVERDLERRQVAFQGAVERTRRCADAAAAVARSGATGKAPLGVLRRPRTPAQVAQTCAEVRREAGRELTRTARALERSRVLAERGARPRAR